MSRATGDDLVSRYDVRLIRDLVNDDLENPIELSDVPGHPHVLSALSDARGDVDTALMSANRYSESELNGLTGNSESLLKRIECDIAMAYLHLRRGDASPEKAAARHDLAEKHLQRLRKGEIVFTLQPQQDAGLPDSPKLVQQDVINSHLLRDRVKNYFPRRRLKGQ